MGVFNKFARRSASNSSMSSTKSSTIAPAAPEKQDSANDKKIQNPEVTLQRISTSDNVAPASDQPAEKTEELAEDDQDETDYPTSWKLVLITIGLCLAVFCM